MSIKEINIIPAIENLPRISLGFYPTPLSEGRHLSAVLGGPRILIKRDDLSGLALGGNKCRCFEFILAEAKKQGADAVISTASSQSNWCLQLAAAGRKLGMKASFVLTKGVHISTQGNLLLHNILDSDVEILDIADIGGEATEAAVSAKMDRVADDLRARGYKPFIVRSSLPYLSTILATVSWVNAADELITQLKDRNIDAQYVIVTNGSAMTQAGLVLGSKYLGANYNVMGISVFLDTDAAVAQVIEKVDAVSDFLDLGVKVMPDEVEVNDSYKGEYEIPNKECIDAIRLVAQTEGIFLDPVYTGRTMAGLIDLVKKRRFKSTDTIIFIHTGGIPALFAYNREIAR